MTTPAGWAGRAAGLATIRSATTTLPRPRLPASAASHEGFDRELTEKEVWFVASGAEEVGTVGMEAFLDAYGEDIRDALIINIDNVGAGQLSWVTAGHGAALPTNQRLIRLAKRVSREHEIIVKPRVYKGLSTDATPAPLAVQGHDLMGFDSSGVPVNWRWKTDTSRNVSEMIDRGPIWSRT
jgi:hypothetical protein